MKKVIVFIAIVFSFKAVYAVTPADPAMVETAIRLAETMTVEQLRGEGRYKCKYELLVNVYGTDLQYEAQAHNLNESQHRLALQCMKERCKQVGRWISGGMSYMQKVSPTDNLEYFQSLGYSEAQANQTQKILNQVKPGQFDSITCENSTPLAHQVVFDSCFSMPMSCSLN